MRQIEALKALRRDTGEGAERRREIIDKVGDSLRRARLSGDEILAPTPGWLSIALPLLALSPLLILALAVWGLPVLLSERASLRAPTPDKMVTVRLLGNFVLVPALAVLTAVTLGLTVSLAAGGAWLLAGLAQRRHIYVVVRPRRRGHGSLASTGHCPNLRGNRVDPGRASLDTRSVRRPALELSALQRSPVRRRGNPQA